MKLNRTLTILAVAFIAINIVFYLNAKTLNGGSSMIYIFIFPGFWLLTFITAIILTIKNRKVWLGKDLRLSTLVALVFCSPVPILLLTVATRPASYAISSGSWQDTEGNNMSSESWQYYSGGKEVTKYFRNGAKDSTWVYFDKKGDTVKTELYKYGNLITKKSYK